MRFLLLSCCAPCSCAVIKELAKSAADFAVLFYNPNIRPQAEYQKRCEENRRVCRLFGVPFIELEYDNHRWCEAVAGLEDLPERGERCSICFGLRLRRAFEYAAANGYDAVASVLGVSRYKDLAQVNRIAHQEAERAGLPYLEIEARKGGRQEARMRLIKELNLYNQTYCGCRPHKVVSPSLGDN
ncbi:MAG: epoxyqueuosine reductase QueH [Alphaproteobacteria bacterium]|nr:epoxyqueuosine reductase QueH [Alphaproteobacteria bacterium]MBQ9235471.1 epoxyqueuosine reductase QueH [Alphaproteobacteria bacterium]